MADAKKDKLQIRNSTVDFLVFTKDAHEDGIEVRVQDHDVWLTQKAIAQLFDVDRSVVTKHLKNVYESGELSEDATCANFAQVADNGKTYHYKFYSLSAIIAVAAGLLLLKLAIELDYNILLGTLLAELLITLLACGSIARKNLYQIVKGAEA